MSVKIGCYEILAERKNVRPTEIMYHIYHKYHNADSTVLFGVLVHDTYDICLS